MLHCTFSPRAATSVTLKPFFCKRQKLCPSSWSSRHQSFLIHPFIHQFVEFLTKGCEKICLTICLNFLGYLLICWECPFFLFSPNYCVFIVATASYNLLCNNFQLLISVSFLADKSWGRPLQIWFLYSWETPLALNSPKYDLFLTSASSIWGFFCKLVLISSSTAMQVSKVAKCRKMHSFDSRKNAVVVLPTFLIFCISGTYPKWFS